MENARHQGLGIGLAIALAGCQAAQTRPEDATTQTTTPAQSQPQGEAAQALHGRWQGRWDAGGDISITIGESTSPTPEVTYCVKTGCWEPADVALEGGTLTFTANPDLRYRFERDSDELRARLKKGGRTFPLPDGTNHRGNSVPGAERNADDGTDGRHARTVRPRGPFRTLGRTMERGGRPKHAHGERGRPRQHERGVLLPERVLAHQGVHRRREHARMGTSRVALRVHAAGGEVAREAQEAPGGGHVPNHDEAQVTRPRDARGVRTSPASA